MMVMVVEWNGIEGPCFVVAQLTLRKLDEKKNCLRNIIHLFHILTLILSYRNLHTHQHHHHDDHDHFYQPPREKREEDNIFA